MQPVSSGSVNVNNSSSVAKSASQPTVSKSATDTANKPDVLKSVTKVEQDKVTLSPEGKALLAALQDVDKGKSPASIHSTDQGEDKTVGDKVESFTFGALGMEHPDKMKEESDGSYSAGQYLSGALTIGGILLALA